MKRLRLDRVRERTEVPQDDRQEVSIVDQSAFDMMMHRKKCANHHLSIDQSGSLFNLFNLYRAEFVRKDENGRWIACILPTKATHKLVGTSWNKDPTRAMPYKTFALSVAAVPIKRKLHATGVKITRPFPKDGVVYKESSSLRAKRSVLLVYVVHMRAKVQKLAIRKLNNDECDKLYASLRRANLILKLR